MTCDLTDALANAVQQLHAVFARYEGVKLAPVSHHSAETLRGLNAIQQVLGSKRRDEVGAQDLLDYFFLAVEHIGTVDDLRHFLPKILELMLVAPDLLIPAHLPSLLRSAGFASWPADERRAVAEFVRSAASLGRIPQDIADDVGSLSQSTRVN